MTHFEDYHSIKRHNDIDIDTFLYINISVEDSSRTISFFTAIPQDAMEKKEVFIADPSAIEPDTHLAIDKNCHFCLERTDCHCLQQFHTGHYAEFDRKDEISEPLYVCESCRQNIKLSVEQHRDTLDLPQILLENL